MGQTGTPSGRTVGVDFGTKRVGLAIADPLGLFAQPVGTFDPSAAIDQLRRIDRESGVDQIVIGWPLLEDGSEGVGTQRVTQYINRLKKAFPDAQIHKQDERFTSEEAKDRIQAQVREGASGRSRGTQNRAQAGSKRSGPGRRAASERGRLDTAAAGVILQEFLDSGSG